MVYSKTQTSSSGQRGHLQKGDRACTIRPETHWIRRLVWPRGTTLKKLERQFSANDPASVWKGLKNITNYKTPSPSTEANQQLAEDLNEFYCRFESPSLTSYTRSVHPSTQPLTLPATPLSPTPALQISADDVRQVFRKSKRRKHQAQMVWHQPVWNPVLTSWPPSTHWSSTDHWSCAKSLPASNAPPSSPSQRNPKLLDLTATDLLL